MLHTVLVSCQVVSATYCYTLLQASDAVHRLPEGPSLCTVWASHKADVMKLKGAFLVGPVSPRYGACYVSVHCGHGNLADIESILFLSYGVQFGVYLPHANRPTLLSA